MTSVTEVRSASARLFAGTWRPLVSVITTLYYVAIFLMSSVVSRAFSALCVYSKFEHHSHPLGYLYVKFRFFRGLQREKNRVLDHSITHPAYLMPPGNEAIALRN